MGQPRPQGRSRTEFIGARRQTQGIETSQYLEERTSTETPLVVASERGTGQWSGGKNRNALEGATLEGESPVRVESRRILE